MGKKIPDKKTSSTQQKIPLKTDKSKTQIEESKPPIIPEKFQSIIYIIILIISVFVFFSSAIGPNKDIITPDNISSYAFVNFIEQANQKGEFPLWIPNIFSGMPCYGSLMLTGSRNWDIFPYLFFGFTKVIGSIFSSDIARLIVYYIILAIGMFWLMRIKDHERFVAFLTALATTFSTSVVVWIMIGHNTKPIVFAMLPYIFIFTEKIKNRFSLVWLALLAFALNIMFEAAHIQMIFYSLMALGIYLIYDLIKRAITNEKPKRVIYSLICVIVAVIFSFLLSADRYLSTLEYNPYSTRSSNPIKTEDNSKNSTDPEKETRNYATSYSFNPEETLTFLVPSYFGFGKMKFKPEQPKGRESTTSEEIMLYTYWGEKETEDAPPYMGILIFLLAIFGAIFYWKDTFVQSLIIICLLALLVSFGKHFSLFYDIFYYAVPGFNKFRAPSMILVLLQFSFPILAGYGLKGIMNWRKNMNSTNKGFFTSFLIVSGVYFFASVIFASSSKDSYIKILKEAATKNGYMQYPQVREFVWDTVSLDWFLLGIIVLITGILVFFYVKRKIPAMAMLIPLAFMLLFDLWRVGWRPLEVSKESIKSKFAQRESVYSEIKKDTTDFRIMDFTQRALQYPNTPAYYLMNSISGYHPAKLRIYQDLLDIANQKSFQRNTNHLINPFMWNLLNVKYIISWIEPNQTILEDSVKVIKKQPVFIQKNELKGTIIIEGNYSFLYADSSFNKKDEDTTIYYVYENKDVLPRAFFVNSIEILKPLEILDKLQKGNFNPREVAFLEDSSQVPKIDTLGTGTMAEIVELKNHYIKIETKTSGNNLLFLSEIYYPPSWKAYIDNVETPIYKTNFAFRSVVVPAGNHIVEFKFDSNNFDNGKIISIIANIMTFSALIIGIVILIKNKKKKV